MTFNPRELEQLEHFLAASVAVVPYVDIATGAAPDGAVGMRHDVDDDLERSLRFAEWEAERGFRASYFLLHTASYYGRWPRVLDAIDLLQALGHEVGLHYNTVAVARQQTADGYRLRALDLLRVELHRLSDAGFAPRGAAAHGDSRCHLYGVSNLDVWDHVTPAELGLDYEAYLLQRSLNTNYVSDNGGAWRSALEHVDGMQTMVLVHPQHWPV